MTPRRGDYGIDAPMVPALFALGALIAAVLAMRMHGARVTWGITAAVLGIQAALYLHATLRDKLVVWDALLDEAGLRGDEQLLDVGCGRGAVLLLAAQRLASGRATGIDLWSTTDQSGNAEQTTRRNAELEGVSDRVDLRTGDMRELPFADGTFDVVTSSLAVHNIPDAIERARAIAEMARVLKPGGRVILADFRHVDDYARTLEVRIGARVERRRLGWRFWYGGPWAATTVAIARMPI